jgi:hypothetical protein
MVTFFHAVGVALAVFLTWATPALSQSPSTLNPPVALGSTDVPYPEHAEGDAEVVLELVIETNGYVSSATVVDGNEPFAEHARAAALGWRFTPAKRDGAAVRARIRAKVAFRTEPAEPGASTASDAPNASVEPATKTALPADAASALAQSEPEEVVVQGVRREIGATTLSKRDIREMPGSFGDAFRAIDALPGVTPLVSGIPYFYTRGAPPNNAGYYVDGVRVPQLFHIGVAQSVIHPGLVDHVDFFPSAAPVRYGGVAGGVVAGATREPALEFRGEANLRLVDAGALVETPFADGTGMALIAGRYGYPGPIISAVSQDTKLEYWDYQARATVALGRDDALSVFALGGHDYYATRSPSMDPQARNEFIEQFAGDFHRIDLRWDHALSGGRVRLAMTGGYDTQGAEPTYISDHSLGARVELEQRLGDGLVFRGGADARFDRYGIRITAVGPGEPVAPANADPPPDNFSAGVYSDFVWKVSRHIELVPGARFDVFASERPREAPATGTERTVVPAVDPRLSARARVAAGVVWLAAIGLSHQYPSLRLGDVPGPVASVPGFPFGVQELQTAVQASQGFELALPEELTLTATGFYSLFSGLTDLSASCFQLMPGNMPEPMPGDPVPPLVCPNSDPVRGRAYGLELLVRRSFSKRLAGWLSYTLSRSTQQAHFMSSDGTETLETVASNFDRTHALNAVLAYDLGRRWRVGGRFVFYSGTPYSRLDGSFPVAPYNAYRNPPFYRVDVRLEKSWRLGSNGSIAFVLEGQNVTLSKEVTGLGLECEGRGMPGEEATTRCEQSTFGPLTIPSVGVEAFF